MNTDSVLVIEKVRLHNTWLLSEVGEALPVNEREVTIPDWDAVIHSELDEHYGRNWVATVDVFELEKAIEDIKAACIAAKGEYHEPYAQVADDDGEWGLDHPTLTLRGMIRRLKAQGRKKVLMYYNGFQERIVVLDERRNSRMDSY